MKIQLNDISPIRKVLKVEISADVVAVARSQATEALQKKAKIPGFRPGKVPGDMLQQKFGHEVEHQTIENIVDLTIAKAFQEAKVFPINKPDFTPGIWLPGGGFTYTLTFEVLPKMELKNYKGLKLNKEEIQVSDEEIDHELKRLQTAMTQLEPVAKETKLEKGHVAQLDFEGMIEGKVFEGGKAKDFIAEIGSGQLLVDFEAQILGAQIGETKNVTFHYPKDYFNKDLAEKKGEFKVAIKDIRQKNVPTLNDDFAKDLGDFKNMEEVKKDAHQRITQAKEYYQKSDLGNQVMEELVKLHPIEVPESLVVSELRILLERYAQEIHSRGQKIEDMNKEELLKVFRPEAEKRVKGYLLIDTIAMDLGLSVSDEELNRRLVEIAKGANKPLDEVKAYYEKQKLLGGLKTQILHEKALENVINEAKIKVVAAKKKKKG